MKYRKATAFAAACMASAALLLAGCVPTQETNVQRGPDFSQQQDAKLDFVQIHNDTIDSFGDADENPYVFITDVSVDGDSATKQITIDALCMSDTTKEEAEQFAAAAVRHANDAAVTQSNEFEQSSQESFGTLYDKYELKLTVRPEKTKDDASTWLVNLDIKPGEEIPLNPDIETYEEDWADTRDAYLEQLANQPVKIGGSAAETESAVAEGETKGETSVD